MKSARGGEKVSHAELELSNTILNIVENLYNKDFNRFAIEIKIIDEESDIIKKKRSI